MAANKKENKRKKKRKKKRKTKGAPALSPIVQMGLPAVRSSGSHIPRIGCRKNVHQYKDGRANKNTVPPSQNIAVKWWSEGGPQ